jgi:hypothetical protein
MTATEIARQLNGDASTRRPCASYESNRDPEVEMEIAEVIGK